MQVNKTVHMACPNSLPKLIVFTVGQPGGCCRVVVHCTAHGCMLKSGCGCCMPISFQTVGAKKFDLKIIYQYYLCDFGSTSFVRYLPSFFRVEIFCFSIPFIMDRSGSLKCSDVVQIEIRKLVGETARSSFVVCCFFGCSSVPSYFEVQFYVSKEVDARPHRHHAKPFVGWLALKQQHRFALCSQYN